MRALLQRVKETKVTVNSQVIGEISKGFLILLGVCQKDSQKEIDYLVEKICNLRVFGDSKDKMNLSLLDIKGDLLIVSQFTLYADCKKGRRPSFTDAAVPEFADELYKKFVQKCRDLGVKVETGQFGAMMEVALINDGPVTIMLDTDELMKAESPGSAL